MKDHERVVCDVCGAQAGKPCTQRSWPHLITRPHRARLERSRIAATKRTKKAGPYDAQ